MSIKHLLLLCTLCLFFAGCPTDLEEPEQEPEKEQKEDDDPEPPAPQVDAGSPDTPTPEVDAGSPDTPTREVEADAVREVDRVHDEQDHRVRLHERGVRGQPLLVAFVGH